MADSSIPEEEPLPPIAPPQPLVKFLQGLGLADLDLKRERDPGRDEPV